MKLRHFVVVAFVLTLLGYLVEGDGQTDHASSPATSRSPSAPAYTPTPSPSPSGVPLSSPTRTASPGTALALLATLPVKGRAPMTGYDRARFGPAWLDADRNGCDTRNDVLAEHLAQAVLEANGCVVAAGVYDDPYTGRRVDYRQGHGSLLDVDHVVALGNSWATGAFGWTVLQRAAFANDPLNLLPADAGANRQKGDGDAATWLPAYKPFRCAYVARQVSVKAKYGLWVTRAEAAAVSRVLASCPDQPVAPDPWDAPTEVDHRITDPGDPAATPTATPTGSPVHYADCDAARAAGAAPVRSGDPGYGRHLDRDGDGAGCE